MTGAPRRPGLVALALLACLSGCGTGGVLSGGGEPARPSRIVVGSKDHPESIIIAKLYGEALAARGYEVEYRHTLTPTDILSPTTDISGIDLFPEYTGALVGLRAASSSAELSAPPLADDAVAQPSGSSAPRGPAVMAMAPATHSEGLAVTRATADALGVTTISELAAHAPDLVLGAPSDCAERTPCLPGLTDVYGLAFASVEPIDAVGLRYQALVDGEIGVAVVETTDAQISAHDLVVLGDDRALYPAYNVIPVVDQAFLDEAPADFETVINAVSARLTTSDLAELNAQVVIELRDPTDVAIAWLREHGLTD